MNHVEPLTLRAVLDVLSHAPLPILAGGTDFYPALRDAPAPEKILDISGIDELRGITRTDIGWRIGAATTWAEIAQAHLPAAFAGLQEAAKNVGSIQIQNAGTIAGNVCNASPAADGVPPLLALNASVELASVGGSRVLPLPAFLLAPRKTARRPDELLVAIHVPDISEYAHSGFIKLGSRRYLVISIVMVSLTVVPDEHMNLQDVRLAVGACSPVAKRLHGLENALRGRSVHEDLVSLVTPSKLSILSPIDDVRGSCNYRQSAVQQLIKRLLASAIQSISCSQRPVS